MCCPNLTTLALSGVLRPNHRPGGRMPSGRLRKDNGASRLKKVPLESVIPVVVDPIDGWY